jgi:hypothetical protein
MATPSKSSTPIDRYIRSISRDQKNIRSLASDAYRRWIGLLVGAVMGMVYGLVSQSINPLLLRGLPLFQPPFGFGGNILLVTLAGGVIGLATAWSARRLTGLAMGALAGVGLLELRAFLSNGEPLLAQFFSGAMCFGVPLAAALAFFLFLPLTLLISWAVDVQCEQVDRPLLYRARLQPLLAVLAIAGLAGLVSLYPGETRRALEEMQAMLQSAQSAQQAGELPAPLQNPLVHGFLENSTADYRLKWIRVKDYKDLLEDPFTHTTNFTGIAAEYSNGYSLFCFFPDFPAEIDCESEGP